MKTVYLVSCVSRKQPQPARAEDLYTSPWFQKAREFVTRRRAEWRILSAKYGLLDPTAVVEPYEQTLNTMSVAERRLWAARVMSSLSELLNENDSVIFLAGDRYREFLIPALHKIAVQTTVPMAGLTIGHQLAWLDKQNGNG